MLLPARMQHRLIHSKVLHRFLRLASWSMLAFAIDKVGMIIIVFALARILGAADYGRLMLAQGLVNSTQIFVVLGAGTMLARYIPAMREESIKRAVEIINLCGIVVLGAATIFTVGGLLYAPIIATTILDVAVSSPVPYLLIIWVLLTVVCNLLLTIMLSFEKGSTMGLTSFVAALFSLAIVPLLSINLGLLGTILGLVAVEVAKATLLLVHYRRLLTLNDVSVFTPARRADTPLLWKFGFPVFLSSAIWGPTIWLGQLIIKTRTSDGLVAVGVFGFANNLLGAVILISSLTNRAALPIQSSLHASGDHDEARRLSWLLTIGQTGAAVAIAIPVAGIAPFIMAGAGADFVNYWPVLIIMITAGVVIASQTTIGNYLLVYQQPYFVSMTLLPWAAVILGSAFAFSAYGAYALAWGLLAASVVRTALFYWKWNNMRDNQRHTNEA